MNINKRKILLFLKFHWIKLLIISFILFIIISLIFIINAGLKAWRGIEPFYRQAQLAAVPLHIYLSVITGLIFGVTYVFLWYWVLFRGGGMHQFTQMRKSAVPGQEMAITWADVIGMEEAKQEAMEAVKLMKDRAQIQRIGGKILRGILMLGPPGCGKTYLAKGIATEARLPFISMSGSEFVEMFVGVGASRIRKIFKQARQFAYTEGGCIIFLDELDAVGARRGVDVGFGGQRESNQTLNQLLVEMDGLKEKDYNIVIIGATNMPENFLDAALLRPGRFDRKIYVQLPNLEDRIKLFQYYMSKVKYDASIDFSHLARRTVSKTPADVANITREAALISVRNNKELIGMREISEAMERIDMGIRHRITFTPHEKEMTAFHEAGHLIITYFHHPTDDVFKATIIPRGPSLGAVYHPPREELHTYTRERIIGNIKVALAGYAAEKLKFNTTSSGVASDFEQATFWVTQMVWKFGMGNNGFIGDYLAFEKFARGSSLLSEEHKKQLNSQMQEILQGCLKEVEETLKKEIQILDRFAKELVAREELDYDEIQAIFKEYGKDTPSHLPTV